MNRIDHKQEFLIRGWMDQAKDESNHYFRFISLWIAFNALCYALFHEEANHQRADLRKSPRPVLTKSEGATADVLLENGKIVINFREPARAKIVICEKYSEETIFDKFVGVEQNRYEKKLDEDEEFGAEIDSFRESIRKQNGFYVLNLSRRDHRDVENWTEEQVGNSQNALSRFDDRRNLRQLKGVLYQVRCNVFHGEKTPGTINDDKIVQAASPVLKRLLGFYLPPTGG